jgi:hemerythrin-like domain-containing protein
LAVRGGASLAFGASTEYGLTDLCRRYCYGIAAHHLREDTDIFPKLGRATLDLAEVLNRLQNEHHTIRLLIERIDALLSTDDRIEPESFPDELLPLLDELDHALNAHFGYEERTLTMPARLLTSDSIDRDALGPRPRP